MIKLKKLLKIIIPLLLIILGTFIVVYAAPDLTIPKVDLSVSSSSDPKDVALSLQIVFLLTILSLAPSLLIMMTSFTRIVIVFSFMRNALGTQQMPPNQVLIGLSLFLTFFIMSPVIKDINEQAYQPYVNGKITQSVAFTKAMNPLREFMMKYTRDKDLALFIKLNGGEVPKDTKDIPTQALIPAFIISELKTAFEIGFFLYIPFLMIDMVVSSTLMSMGMMMLPPVMISMPFKILLFVMVDGWNLLTKAIILTFNR